MTTMGTPASFDQDRSLLERGVPYRVSKSDRRQPLFVRGVAADGTDVVWRLPTIVRLACRRRIWSMIESKRWLFGKSNCEAR